MAEGPTILVVGSINMDLVMRAPRMPAPGQTVLGKGFTTSPGGKGANQAVAVARLGGRSKMIARVGRDAFGERLRQGLESDGVDCTDVIATPEAPTGVAMIIVDARGENSIVVAGGANDLVTPDDLFSRQEAFKGADIVLLQLELPLPTVRATIELARRHGCKIVLDPAPAPEKMPQELCQVDVLTPNVVEAEGLSGPKAFQAGDEKLIASDLITRGAAAVVLKLGPKGSVVAMADGHFYTVPPYKVNVVDTTGAGDAFTAALAVAMARGEKMQQAAKFANAAGALACTELGAQVSMPTAAEVNILMEDQRL